VKVYRENLETFGLVFGFFFSVQLVQLVNGICLRKLISRRRKVLPGGPSDFTGDLQSVTPAKGESDGRTQVKKILVRASEPAVAGQKSERRISVGSDLAFSGTYTGPTAAGRGRRMSNGRRSSSARRSSSGRVLA